MQILHIYASFGGVFFCGVGTKYDGIQRIVKGYVYLGGYVLNYLLKMIEGMLFTKGTFIWQWIVVKYLTRQKDLQNNWLQEFKLQYQICFDKVLLATNVSHEIVLP